MRVLACDGIHEDGLILMREAGWEVEVSDPIKDPAVLAKKLEGVDALLVRSATAVTAESIANATQLKVIGRAGAGELFAHQLEDLAVSAALARGQSMGDGRLVRRRGVLARLADQGAQLLRIGAGELLYPVAEDLVIGDQAVAPLFGPVQGQRELRRDEVDELRLSEQLEDWFHLGCLKVEHVDRNLLQQLVFNRRGSS